ncbi:MAG: AMP-binding protein [Ignavibacteriales bacterium]|nr:AMP-binding protein [Ignavibacteriales bacterium]
MNTRTIVGLLEESASKYADRPYLMEKRDGEWRSTTYLDTRRRARAFAAGLIEAGVEKGDRAAIISEGRADWVIAELGVALAGAVCVPISVRVEEREDLLYRLKHSGSKIAIVSERNRKKIEEVAADLSDLEHVLLFDGGERRGERELLFEEIVAAGERALERDPEALERRVASVGEDDPVNICYTSGTTADPKGIVLTHRNYTANVEQSLALFDVTSSYRTLLILPWDHSFAHTVGVYALMKSGASFAAVEQGASPLDTIKNIPRNIREIKPTFLLSVPALAKNFRKNIEAGIAAKGGLAKKLFEIGLRATYRYNGLGHDRGAGVRKLHAPLAKLFDAILLRKVRAAFGGELEFFVGGGALLDIELQRFFYAIGIPMFQGYGLTEAAPVISSNAPRRHKLGSSGVVAPGVEVKIADERGAELPVGERGEIIARGENVMAGYWRNESATAEALRDGWLHTGDLGYFDDDGFLHVLGRTKSLLVGNDGEKYSPEGIEETLVECAPFVDQIMLHNAQSPYTVALLSPDWTKLRAEVERRGERADDEAGRRAAIAILAETIARFKSGGDRAGEFPERWLPAAFAILDEGFTEENRLLNSTLKVVRARVVERHAERIERLFDAEGKDPHNEENRAVVGRLLNT